MRTANLNDVRIYYEDPEEARLCRSCGLLWPCDTWKSMSCRLCRGVTARFIFDCRGTGYSSKPDHGYTIPQFAKGSAGLLEYLKISRVHAAGFALGGQIVQALVIERSDLVATLTMAAAGAGSMGNSGAPREMRNADEEEIRTHGFKRFIRGHVEKHAHGVRCKILQRSSGVSRAIGCLWKRQPSPEQHRCHHEARRT